MKLFQECQKNFATLGINSNQQMCINGRMLITYLVLGLGLIGFVVYLFFEANTFQEYSNIAYTATSMTVALTVFTNIVSKTAALFKLIHNFEEVLEKSE